jgi:hypothetical protein
VGKQVPDTRKRIFLSALGSSIVNSVGGLEKDEIGEHRGSPSAQRINERKILTRKVSKGTTHELDVVFDLDRVQSRGAAKPRKSVP